MIEVIPGIFEKEWEEIVRKINLVRPYVDWVQIDISDGTLVPATSLTEFAQFAQFAKSLSLEAHLMVEGPVKYIRPLVDSGFKRLIAHLECQDPRHFLDEVKFESVETMIAIDGVTEITELEPFLGEIDGVLIMTNEAGEKGLEFMPENVEKIRLVAQNYPDLPIEVEGGLSELTAKIVREAGATRIVSTSYIFKHPESIAAAIERLKHG